MGEIFLTILGRNSLRALTSHSILWNDPHQSTVNRIYIFFYPGSEPTFQEGQFGFKQYLPIARWVDLICSPVLCGNCIMGGLGFILVQWIMLLMQTSTPKLNGIVFWLLALPKKSNNNKKIVTIHLGFPQNR